jgi:hypothetical protein
MSADADTSSFKMEKSLCWGVSVPFSAIDPLVKLLWFWRMACYTADTSLRAALTAPIWFFGFFLLLDFGFVGRATPYCLASCTKFFSLRKSPLSLRPSRSCCSFITFFLLSIDLLAPLILATEPIWLVGAARCYVFKPVVNLPKLDWVLLNGLFVVENRFEVLLHNWGLKVHSSFDFSYSTSRVLLSLLGLINSIFLES